MSNEDINKDATNFSGEEGNFGMPENYFDSFSARLFKKIAAEDELQKYPLLTSAQRSNPFTVPAGYFESKEELLQYPLLIENKAISFAVPNIYFTTLAERICHTVSVVEEKETYPLLYSYNNQTVFRTPDNYFEEFALPVLREPVPKKESVIIPLFKRIKLSYKIAAAITLLIGLGILFYLQPAKPLVQNNDCNTFACLDKNDILNSGYILHVSDDNIIDLMDEKSLSDSLSLKKDGKTQKVDMSDVSDNVDLNTLTDNL